MTRTPLAMILSLFLPSLQVAPAQTFDVKTIAGSTTGGGYVNGQADSSRFSGPRSTAVDGSGTVYVADAGNHVVRAIAPDGNVTTIAGEPGVSGSSDGAGTAAHFNAPGGIATDDAGMIYVADTLNHTIRRVTHDGVVKTLAGSPGVTGTADGTGSAARFTYPEGIAVDGGGNIYVADTSNHVIRRVTASGVVATLAGQMRNRGASDGFGTQASFNYPFGVACDINGNIFVADTDNHTIRKITPEGRVTTVAGVALQSGASDGVGTAARFHYPWGLSVDGSGTIYVADTHNEIIRSITPDGTVKTLAGTTSFGSHDGVGSDARFSHPSGISVDHAGMIYVADTDNEAIRMVAPNGVVSTLAGSMPSPGSTDGAGATSRFYLPWGVAVDSHGAVFVADSAHTIRRISLEGNVTTFAGVAGQPGSADGIGSAAHFSSPSAIAVDANDNLYVADTGNHVIRKITQSGFVSTIAGASGQSGTADGTGSQARFYDPIGVTVDSHGNVYVADTYNHLIRMVDQAGVVTTFAGSTEGGYDGVGRTAEFDYPTGITTDSARNLYVADWGNHSIRKITQAGVVTTVAGHLGHSGNSDGTGTNAYFDYPSAVAATGNGTLFVTDTDNHTVREISATGRVTTLAGMSGTSGNVDGPGPAARFFYPQAIAVSAAGQVFIADTYNHAIRVATVLPPVIARFECVPNSIVNGKSATLFWSASDGTSASIDNGVGGIPVIGSRIVAPAVTTTFTLTVVGPGGTATATATVVVTAGHHRPSRH